MRHHTPDTLTRPAVWQDDAACLAHAATFDRADTGADADAAKRICKVCPVRLVCLDDALLMEKGAEESRAGVRGGKDATQRARLARSRRRAAA